MVSVWKTCWDSSALIKKGMLQLPIAMNFFSFSGSDKISLSLDLVMWEIWLPFSMPISMIKGKLSLLFLDFAAPPDGTRLDNRVPKAVIAFFNSAVATRVADASSTKGFRSAVLALACSRLTCCNRPREVKRNPRLQTAQQCLV